MPISGGFLKNVAWVEHGDAETQPSRGHPMNHMVQAFSNLELPVPTLACAASQSAVGFWVLLTA
jgi:hypothetical protein